jgi:hypothetical protein
MKNEPINFKETISNYKRVVIKKAQPKKQKSNEKELEKSIRLRFETLHRKNFPNCNIVINPFSTLLASVGLSESLIKRIYSLAKNLGFKKAQPDLLFLQPNSKYIGLALEIKTLKGNPYLKDGVTLKKNTHLENQQKYLKELESVGYYATFGVGFEHCSKIIDKYFEIV